MNKRRKSRAGCHQATLKYSEAAPQSTGLASRFKAAVVTLAFWGVIPVSVTEWTIRWGGHRND
jgi:hypothetical protein